MNAVISNDISCVSDLEHYVVSATSRRIASELSRMVDTMLTLGAELSTRDFSPTREMYSGPCAFLKAKPEFFEAVGYSSVHHPDGVYGWSHPLGNPGLEVTHLDCSHVDCISHEESVRQIAATLVSLLQSTEGAENTHPANTPRSVEQTSSEQVAACDADGSDSGHTVNLGQ